VTAQAKPLTSEEEWQHVLSKWLRAEVRSREGKTAGVTEQWSASLGRIYATTHCTDWFASESDAIHAAFEFTQARKEEIRKRRYALSLLKLISHTHEHLPEMERNPHDHRADGDALLEIVAREQAALDELLKGWK